jgi:hypothetical protein
MLIADRPILIISDLQMPFEALKALEFCKYLKKHYRIPNENILNVGDEIDSYHGGRWPKDPNGTLTSSGEIAMVRQKIREWRAEFPHMKVCISNHGLRWVRKATAAEIPSEVLRSYQEIFEIPDTWKYQMEWRFTQSDLKAPFRMIHGMGYSGAAGAKNAAIDAGMNTAIGHLASHPGVWYGSFLNGMKLWAMNTGCLIDRDAYAFEYGKEHRNQPGLGVGIVFNKGKMPLWYPYE